MASSTCWWSDPANIRRPRWTSTISTDPTVVGLAACPHGPGPSSAALTVRMSEGSTVAQACGSLILQGSHNRSAHDTTAGRSTETSTHSSSCSNRSDKRSPCRDRWRAPVANGSPNNWASCGGHLSGVGIHRVASHHDQIEGSEPLQGGGQGLGGGPGVGARELRVANVDAAVRPVEDGLPAHVLRRGRPQGEHGDLPASGPGHLRALGHCPPAVVVHVHVDAVSHHAAVGSEHHVLEDGGSAWPARPLARGGSGRCRQREARPSDPRLLSRLPCLGVGRRRSAPTHH